MAGAKPGSSASSRPRAVREALGQPQGRFFALARFGRSLTGPEPVGTGCANGWHQPRRGFRTKPFPSRCHTMPNRAAIQGRDSGVGCMPGWAASLRLQHLLPTLPYLGEFLEHRLPRQKLFGRQKLYYQITRFLFEQPCADDWPLLGIKAAKIDGM